MSRGKVSEGLDFSDRAARSVIMVGIPYAVFYDPKVILKKKYLDDKAKASKGMHKLRGADWYNTEAARAVNQAIG